MHSTIASSLHLWRFTEQMRMVSIYHTGQLYVVLCCVWHCQGSWSEDGKACWAKLHCVILFWGHTSAASLGHQCFLWQASHLYHNQWETCWSYWREFQVQPSWASFLLRFSGAGLGLAPCNLLVLNVATPLYLIWDPGIKSVSFTPSFRHVHWEQEACRCYRVGDAGRDRRDCQSFNVSFVSYQASSLAIASSSESSWSSGATWLFIQLSWATQSLALFCMGLGVIEWVIGWELKITTCATAFGKLERLIIIIIIKEDTVHSLV